MVSHITISNRTEGEFFFEKKWVRAENDIDILLERTHGNTWESEQRKGKGKGEERKNMGVEVAA